jgi:hypothetical protein
MPIRGPTFGYVTEIIDTSGSETDNLSRQSRSHL